MTEISQTQDPLTLDLIKAHLLIAHNEDDILLEHYKEASLEIAEKYLNLSILERLFESTPDEITSSDILSLHLPYKPKNVLVHLQDTTTYESEFYFDRGSEKIFVMNDNEDIVKVEAYIQMKNVSSITQLRLLIIGTWYENRESTTARNLKEVPLSLMFMIDKLKESDL